MKSLVRTLFWVLLVLAGISTWMLFGHGTDFSESHKYFTLSTADAQAGKPGQSMEGKSLLKQPWMLDLLISVSGNQGKIKAGKYELLKGQSLWSVARMLKNGRQAEIKLVINRIRTKEDFAHLIASKFNQDSLQVLDYLNNPDSLKQWGVDTGTVFTTIIQDTYLFYWNSSLNKIFQRLYDAKNQFWNKNNRLAKAEAMGFKPETVYILASIVDEETNYDSDKFKIASVYINRLHKQMPLQACPTIKFAMRDFTLTRIYEKYLSNPSPYNTYKFKGLPPGPICTPSPKTIDIILDAPKTDYLFFVAKSDFSGYHHFSSNYKEHDAFAKEYQKALDIYMAKKANTH